MSAADTAAAMMTALSAVEGNTAVTADSASSLASFPATVLTLPDFGWETFNTPLPTDATFQVYVVVKSDGYALPALESALYPVLTALWEVTNVVVSDCVRGTFQAGGSPLPAYVLTCEVAL